MIDNWFEDYIENPVRIGVFTIIEIVASIIIYNFKHRADVLDITNSNFGALKEAFEIFQISDYPAHLIGGFIWILFLLGLIIFNFREKRYLGSLLYILMLIIFWIIFWDPIVTTFLTITIFGGLIMLSMDS